MKEGFNERIETRIRGKTRIGACDLITSVFGRLKRLRKRGGEKSLAH